MRVRMHVSALLLLLAGPPAAADEAAAAQRLVAATLADTPLLSDLRELVDAIGGRPTGSPALEQAVDWSLARLRASGVDTARTEDYVAPRVWLARSERAEVSVPALPGASLRVAGMPFSASTPPEGLEAEVADAGAGDQAGFDSAGSVRGKWVLVHSEPMQSIADLFREYLELPGLLARLRAGQAAGLLYMSNRPARLLYRHNVNLDASAFPLPCALVEREGALRLARLVRAGGPVKVKATLLADAPERRTFRNVVAQIEGSTEPDEVVLLGAHLDSWDLGRGALDNGCNVALVIDVARQMAALARAGVRPRRSVRFVLYTGEEAGLLGSWGEVRAGRAALDRVRAQVIFDEGTGRTSGFSLGGRDDLRASVTRALLPAAGLGPFEHTSDAFIGTDNYDYLIEGVPTLVANQDGAPYLPDYHAESDTYDKADLRELKANVAIAAATVWGLAESQTLPGRLTRAQVEALVTATGLDQQMKTFGLWDDFAAGRRGRALEAR